MFPQIQSIWNQVQKLQNESALQSHEYTTNIDETSSSNTASKLTYIQKLKIRFPYYRLAIDIFIGCFFTAWWLSIVIQPKHRHQWLIPTVIWGMIMVRLITWHIKILPWLLNKVKIVWDFFTGYVYKVLSKISKINHWCCDYCWCYFIRYICSFRN